MAQYPKDACAIVSREVKRTTEDNFWRFTASTCDCSLSRAGPDSVDNRAKTGTPDSGSIQTARLLSGKRIVGLRKGHLLGDHSPYQQGMPLAMLDVRLVARYGPGQCPTRRYSEPDRIRLGAQGFSARTDQAAQ